MTLTRRLASTPTQERGFIIRPCLRLSYLYHTCSRSNGARLRRIALAIVASVSAVFALLSGTFAYAANAVPSHVQSATNRTMGIQTQSRPPHSVGPCASLNLWATDTRGSAQHGRRTVAVRRPVLVWIPDDGRKDARARYDGAHLAEKGVIVVTMPSARATAQCVGTPGSAGVRTLRAHLAALQWVHDNIAAFGGDAARVTVVGIGSGATHAQALLSSALARPLFQQLAAFDGQMPPMRAGQLAHVPVLLGVSRTPEYGAREAIAPTAAASTVAGTASEQLRARAVYDQWLLTEFGANAADAAHVDPFANAAGAYRLAMHDRRQTYGMLHLADLQASAEAAVFLAVASVPAEAPDENQQVDRDAWPALLMNNPAALISAPDAGLLALADTLSDYLVAFATHGHPAVSGRPHWPAYDTGIRNYLELSGNIHTARDPLTDVLELHRPHSEAAWKP